MAQQHAYLQRLVFRFEERLHGGKLLGRAAQVAVEQGAQAERCCHELHVLRGQPRVVGALGRHERDGGRIAEQEVLQPRLRVDQEGLVEFDPARLVGGRERQHALDAVPHEALELVELVLHHDEAAALGVLRRGGVASRL